jgi:RNA polymerase sigma factor (sigma-70 family)
MAGVAAKQFVMVDLEASSEEPSDASLLDRFLNRKGLESEDAFRCLVVRHGPMVLGICRCQLNQTADAEDAFQATFLVLAQKGASIRDRRVLAGWLQEVAYRIAARTRIGVDRRRNFERQGTGMSLPALNADDPAEEAAWNELRPVLHQEVRRLPEKYRIPVILSYLEGKTNEEIAKLLRCPVGTVKGRLSRARDRLRSRLLRRGMALSAAFVITALSRETVFAESVPLVLVNRTLRVVGKLRAAAAGADPISSDLRPLRGETDSTRRIEALANADQRDPKPAHRAVIFVLSIVSITTAIGTALAVLIPGGSAQVRAAFSAFVRGSATNSTCR